VIGPNEFRVFRRFITAGTRNSVGEGVFHSAQKMGSSYARPACDKVEWTGFERTKRELQDVIRNGRTPEVTQASSVLRLERHRIPAKNMPG
jgi:hypothetical protein